MKTATKRFLYILIACFVLFVSYCVIKSPREAVTGLILFLVGVGIFVLGALLEDRAKKIPLFPILMIVGGAGLAIVGLLGLTKPIWRNVVSENTRLFMAIGEGNNDAAVLILEQKPELINTAHYYDNITLLHQAAASGNWKMTKYLLERGADQKACNVDDKNPLQLAKDKRSGMESAPNAGWSMARNGDLREVIRILTNPPPLINPNPSHGHTTGSEYIRFSRWNISFDYPREWKEHSSDREAMMKAYLANEVRPYEKQLQEFVMIADPNNKVALLVTKSTIPQPTNTPDLIEDRKLIYNDAKRAGDVTKINYIKETRISKLPAVEEDIERRNGGRGRTHKIIDGTTIYEISLVMHNAKEFSKYSSILKHIISSILVKGQ